MKLHKPQFCAVDLGIISHRRRWGKKKDLLEMPGPRRKAHVVVSAISGQ